jgi:hypothetical protein
LASVYDLDTLKQVEAVITPTSATYAFQVSPVVYLPIFVLPFQLLAYLPAQSSYWLWAIGNLFILAFYLRFFIWETTGSKPSRFLLALSLLSLPVYWNVFDGQVNVWLVVCTGETLRASLAGRNLRSGLWLAGLLLKPQFLILMVPVLLLRRAWKTLGGLAFASTCMLACSWLLVGSAGFNRLLGLWLGFGQGMPTNDVGMMMNWRMVGSTLATIAPPQIGWAVIVIGSAATVLAAWYLWHSGASLRSEPVMVAWLGLLAATLLIAWHSHVHTAMLLLPPLLYVVAMKQLPEKVFLIWVILPAALYFAAFLVAAAIQANLLPGAAGAIVDFARGVGEFGMNIYLVLWAIRQLRGQALVDRVSLTQQS